LQQQLFKDSQDLGEVLPWQKLPKNSFETSRRSFDDQLNFFTGIRGLERNRAKALSFATFPSFITRRVRLFSNDIEPMARSGSVFTEDAGK